MPIEITAIAKPGYIFSGWDGIDIKDEYFNIILTHDLNLNAIFKKK